LFGKEGVERVALIKSLIYAREKGRLKMSADTGIAIKQFEITLKIPLNIIDLM